MPDYSPNLFVATDGNDDTGDGSSSQPFATLLKAMTECNTNDVILVRQGNYQEKFNYSTTKNMTIVGEGLVRFFESSDESLEDHHSVTTTGTIRVINVTFENTAVTSTPFRYGLLLSGGVVIASRLTVIAHGKWAFRVRGGTAYIRDCIIYGGEAGIDNRAVMGFFDNCEVYLDKYASTNTYAVIGLAASTSVSHFHDCKFFVTSIHTSTGAILSAVRNESPFSTIFLTRCRMTVESGVSQAGQIIVVDAMALSKIGLDSCEIISNPSSAVTTNKKIGATQSAEVRYRNMDVALGDIVTSDGGVATFSEPPFESGIDRQIFGTPSGGPGGSGNFVISPLA